MNRQFIRLSILKLCLVMKISVNFKFVVDCDTSWRVFRIGPLLTLLAVPVEKQPPWLRAALSAGLTAAGGLPDDRAACVPSPLPRPSADRMVWKSDHDVEKCSRGLPHNYATAYATGYAQAMAAQQAAAAAAAAEAAEAAKKATAAQKTAKSPVIHAALYIACPAPVLHPHSSSPPPRLRP